MEELLEPLKELHDFLRDEVLAACEDADTEALSAVASEDAGTHGDVVYAIDRVSESALIDWIEREVARYTPIVLVAEGIAGGRLVLPQSASEEDAQWVVIVDPIDGTRGLMYQKRSAWILTGVAPNRGERTSLADIGLALQSEIPTRKQTRCDRLWAVRGQGARAERFDLHSGETTSWTPRPSRATSIAHGFATVARYFPGGRDVLAALDEEVLRRVLGEVQPGLALCFEDQYIATGGQLYELMSGHDRFVADLRPLLPDTASPGICCHPYDICTELIARELGVLLTDPCGEPISTPLDVTTDVAWVAYANEAIRKQVEPALREVLSERGWIRAPSGGS